MSGTARASLPMLASVAAQLCSDVEQVSIGESTRLPAMWPLVKSASRTHGAAANSVAR